MSNIVTCNTCKSNFEALWDNPDFGGVACNAADCASIASKEGVRSYYGSRYDCTEYTWPVGPAIHVKMGVICDGCMTPMIGSGALRYKQNYMTGDRVND